MPIPTPTPSPIPIPIIGLASVDSTNDEARRRLAAGGVTAPFAILSREQTAGRGTRGRHWDSPAGAGLYLSLAMPGESWPLAAGSPPTGDVRPPVQLAHTLAAGVAAAEALAEGLGIVVELKPVNDLLVDGRKLGGILVETVVRGGRTESMIIGVGINLCGTERVVAGGGLPAVSVEQLRPSGPTVGEADTANLAERLVARLAAWVARTVTEGQGPAVAAWRDRAISGAELPAGL